ncbi:DNA-directed DNA polymerase [Sarracenia purpurea var. burkii]
MADEQPIVAGRRRSRGADAEARAGALERLKAIRRGGRREGGGFQIKMEDPIYDTVGEDEYDALVAKRREEVRGFIVDDDGLGYGDEGQEEDWSQAGGPMSSDESESELERRKKKKTTEKKEPPPKKPSALSAAAALMGKQRLSSMFTSSLFKKSKDDKAKNLSCDSIVDDVIAEFAPDEADRERRRRGHASLSAAVKCSTPINSITSIKRENPPVDGIDSMSRPESVRVTAKDESESLLGKGQQSVMTKESDSLKEFENGQDLNTEMRLDPNLKLPESSTKGSPADESLPDGIEVKEAFVLNAKIKEEKNPAFSATAEWQAVRNAGNGSIGHDGVEANHSLNSEEKPDFVLDSDGSLPFYIIDAHEEFYGANIGNLYLFGKVKVESRYYSCCVVVKNMQRCIYAIPNGSLFQNDAIMKLEKDAKDSQISPTIFHTKLQEMASGLKTEIAQQLLDRNVSSFSMAPVKRNYAFERSDIPFGENYVLKINYPFKDPPLPSDLKGELFSALLGTRNRYNWSELIPRAWMYGQSQPSLVDRKRPRPSIVDSALELFLVKRKIKGPSWLSVSKFSTCSAQRVSWCKFEVIVDCPKNIQISTSSKNTAEIPPVVVTAMNLKTVINEKQNVNEIVSASIICCHKAKGRGFGPIDSPTLASEWMRPGILSHFTVVRKLDGSIFPMGFTKEVSDRNSNAGPNVISIESRQVLAINRVYFQFERALLNRLMIELHKLDSDVLVGHNISGFDLDVLLHRSQACRVPSNMWSKIGRLKRSVMPKLTKGSTIFGSGASPGIMSCIAGRLLCDTYLCSRDLLKEVSYSLTQLAKTQLNKDRKEIAPHDVQLMFQSSESLMDLIECSETDAWLSMELMFHLSVLPLTRQLTNISGNLWGKTLQGARAQRVEFLLLHAFHAKKYIVPDKSSPHPKETKMVKRKVDHGVEDKVIDDLDVDNTNVENDLPRGDHGKAKKGPAYSGGLVLEPKRGLYDKYILLLDFNSLYPSIIQEYNICFTTIERSLDGSGSRLPSSKKTGVLPELLKNLVERRRMVKSWLKTASGLKVQQLDIQQQALKLTANSMYGCLGFSNSRFYAKPLAELITLQVIYGDTDSIMIYSGLDDIAKAKVIAGKVIQEVNKKYRCLEIDLDGLYKRMLLLKKKKYAAVKIQFKDGTPYEVIERKGLDMVRRDWSLLSKELGDFCLGQILSGGSCEDVVESIHSALMKVNYGPDEDVVNSDCREVDSQDSKVVPLNLGECKFDSKQCYVLGNVALRLKRNGYSSGCSAGDTVPYVICCEQGTSSNSSTGISQRARHPDELKRDNGKWMIDIDYYLSQQIHPVVSRLCASIQGTSPARLADCLGLDSSKFQSKSSGGVNNDASISLLCAVDDKERYGGCQPLILTCPSCSGAFECPTVLSSIRLLISEKQTDSQAGESSRNFWHKLHCPKCPEEGDVGRMSPALIANQVKRQAEGFISTYYNGLMTCDDETCEYTSRGLNLRVIGDSERGTVCPNYPRCNGHLIRKYTEADLYRQLTYFCHVLDTVRCIDKVEQSIKTPVEKELVRIRPLVDLAASTAQRIRDRCAFGWVQLKDLIVTI